jgi:hypothetical protein
MRGVVAGAALAAALVAPGLTGCTGVDDGSSAPSPDAGSAAGSASGSARPTATPSTPPPTATAAPRPRDGACYRLDLDEAVAPTSAVPPVPCSRPHTALTYAVGTLDTVVDGHLLAVDSRRVQEQPARSCPSRLASFLGATADDLRLSMLRPVWFTPTVAESDAGADWFRCDVIALAGNDRLAPLTGRLTGARYAMCGTTEPGRPAFERVGCGSRHAWRAVRTVPLGAQAGPRGAYPGAATVRAAGAEICKDTGQRASSDRLNFSWGYEWPSARQWSGGQTYGRCWVPD